MIYKKWQLKNLIPAHNKVVVIFRNITDNLENLTKWWYYFDDMNTFKAFDLIESMLKHFSLKNIFQMIKDVANTYFYKIWNIYMATSTKNFHWFSGRFVGV